jgi:hypothetical protein
MESMTAAAAKLRLVFDAIESTRGLLALVSVQ